MAQRLRLAHSWWLASGLVRRHGDLRIIGDGLQYQQRDTLWLMGPGDERRIGINRVHAGGIHFLVSGTGSIPYEEFFKDADPYAFVSRIEAAAGLKPRSGALPSSPKMLAYRTTAQVLMATVSARVPLEVGQHGGSGGAAGFRSPSGGLSKFPLAEAASLTRRPDDVFGEPGYRYWTIARGEDVVAALDTDGNVYQGQAVHHLAHEYDAYGRTLSATLSAVLPSLLQ